MRSKNVTTTTMTLFAGLSLMGVLAGCTAAADEPTTDTTPETAESEAPEESTESDATTGGVYTDGTYEAEGEYQSPNGTESVDVTVTLEADVITAVEVVGSGSNPNSQRFQGEFSDGIGDVVVGQNIDEISVSKVAGSSLTSGGFNAAIDEIKAEAAA
jgi:uncharacterized protein with FMN-binding domain